MVSASRLSSLIAQRRQAQAILNANTQRLRQALEIEGEAEDVLFEVAERRGLPIFKDCPLRPGQLRVGAPPRTESLIRRIVSPILRFFGLQFISGSSTFSAAELEQAEYTVFFATENGFFAEMRFSPMGRPFYSPVTREEADLLRSEAPPPELIARLFTEIEPVDN